MKKYMQSRLEDAEKRQAAILVFIKENKNIAIGKIFKHVYENVSKVTRITISRDLMKLLELKLIKKQGAGRGVTYQANKK